MVLSDVLQTSKQHLLFSNSISTGLKDNVKSCGLTYAMPFPVIVWHGTKDVYLVLAPKIQFLSVWGTNGLEICCMYNCPES